MKQARWTLVAGVVMVVTFGWPRPAGSQGAPGSINYREVLDALFAPTRQDGPFVLRVGSGEHGAEMQLAFFMPHETDCGVTLWYPPVGSGAISEQVRALVAADQAMTSEAAVMKIEVVKQRIEIPCDGPVARLLRGVTELALTPPRYETVAVDGVSYALSVDQGAVGLSYRSVGPSIGIPSGDPTVDYLSAVGSAVLQLIEP